MTEENKHPGGRPTDYKPEYCQIVIELGKQGKTITQMACELDISKQTLYDWKEAHTEFLDAITRATQHSQAWWENAGQTGMFLEKFNAAVYNKQMGCRFRDDYTDKNITSVEGPVHIKNTIDAESGLLEILNLAAKAKASGLDSEKQLDTDIPT